jgi:hypothetical protein
VPILTSSTAHFNPFSPLTQVNPPVIDGVGTAYDADVAITANQPVSGTAVGTGQAFDATVSSNTLPAGMTALVLDEQWVGTSLASRWHINTDLDWGASGNRIQAFRPGNVSISAATSGGSGNSLKLVSKRETYQTKSFTAGMIESRPTGVFYPLYGMFEARMKMPHCQGIWPAFWLRQRASASICEIDIMEYFHAEQPAKGRMTLHRTANNGTTFTSNVNKVAPFFEAPTLTPGWHTFTVSILPESGNTRIKGWCDSPSGVGTPDWNYLDTQSNYWAGTQGTARADYAFGEEYWDITIQGSQIGGSWLCHPDDPKGYSRWLDTCVSGGTKPNACNTSVGGYNIWTDAANHGGTGLSTGLVYEIDYVKVWSAM